MLLSRLSLNSLWLVLSRVATQLGMALFTILLARGLGSAMFGQYAFMASVIVVGNVFTTFGTDMLLIREIAATDDLSKLASACLIQLVLSGLFIGIILAGSMLMSTEGAAARAALQIYSLSMLPLAFYTVFTTALRGRQRMLAYALVNLILMVMQIMVAVWLRGHSGTLVDLARLLLLVQIAAALFAGVICALEFSDFNPAWQFSFRQALGLLGASASIAVLGMLGIAYQRSSLILLPVLAGASATGWFSAGARLIEAAKIAHIAVFTALYPAMAQARGTSGSNWSQNFRIPGLYLLAGAALGSTVLYSLAGILVPALFGPQYNSSIHVVRILAWILIPYALNSFLTLAFLARGEETAIARALTASVLVLLALTAWWVPRAGASGAAWAGLSAEITQSAILLWIDVRRLRILPTILRPQNVQ